MYPPENLIRATQTHMTTKYITEVDGYSCEAWVLLGITLNNVRIWKSRWYLGKRNLDVEAHEDGHIFVREYLGQAIVL